MGEEEKKPEEKKPEEAKKPEEEKKEAKEEEEKKEEKPAEESKEGKEKEKEAPPPPPPEEFVYRVFMHCEGCARKVKRSLRGFEGVEDVITDHKAHKVLVKGKTADPLKVLDRIQRKSRRKVELLTPLPKPPAEDPKEKEKPKPEEKKEEPQVIVVTLKVHMHCEACAQEIKKRIQRMKGVQSADPDLKSSQVAVKGVFDPTKLVEYVYKKTGKHADIVKQEPEKKEAGEKGGEEKKEDKKEGAEEKKEEKKEGEDETKTEVKKNEYNFHHSYYDSPNPKYINNEYMYPPPPPQIFSDENPNACSVM